MENGSTTYFILKKIFQSKNRENKNNRQNLGNVKTYEDKT